MRRRIPARSSRHRLAGLAAILACVWACGCAVNPATGKRQFVLVSEAQEISMGQQSDGQILEQFGAYDDDGLQVYVSDLGQSLAARSERPQLEWSFRVLDDPLVNAFALPGGYIYITRGILAHFNNEAELASVLGHEIGHVTARHSVSQISKAQLAQLGLSVGAVLAPDNLEGLVGLAETGLGLLFLKYGRDDERQADELGLRYMIDAGYDPEPMTDVFETLGRIVGDDGDRAPTWASTHPHPEDREERISQQIDALNRDFSGAKVEAGSFLGRIDGIVFGEDPRHGFFQDNLFLHPEMNFRIRLPEGWKLQNQRRAVIGISEERDALVRLTLSGQETASGALQSFFERSGFERGRSWTPALAGLTAAASGFRISRESGALDGEVVFGVALDSVWDARRPAIRAALGSFERVTDRRVLEVEPARLEIVRLPESMTLESFAERYEASVEIETLAAINGVDPGARLERGRSYKVVRGGELPPVDR
jgi:predicted Zn-dependent protease